MKKIFLSIILFFASVSVMFAVTAYNKPITVTQPDGTVLTIRVHGDEFLHWTTCGNSLVVKSSDGYWHYAVFNENGVVNAQGARVQSNLPGDGSSVTPPASAVEKAMKKRQASMKKSVKSPRTVSQTAPPLSTGEKHFLILLIEFKDKKFTLTKTDFTDLLSSDNYTYNEATGSVNKYYQDVSFGKFDPQFDVYGPIEVPYTSAQCAENALDAVVDACQYADQYLDLDFTQYCNEDPTLVDNVFFFFPGYNSAEGGGDDTIWPHAATYYEPFLYLDGVGIYHYGCTSEFKGSSGETMAGIGTFCHEFGHVIGLPDFYDIDNGTNGQGRALETLSLMSSGNYNNEGRTPPYFTYEEKHILGWDEGLTPLTEGVNTLEKTSTNKSYYNPTPTDGEYYLYESRPCEGWDRYTYAPGMAIYHVDKSDNVLPDGSTAAQHWDWWDINSIASHQCMDLVETVYPESSVRYTDEFTFPGYRNVTSFTSATLPSATSWSGMATGYNLTDISFDEITGNTTFNVSIERKLMGTVSNTSLQPIPGVEITVKYVSAIANQTKSVSSVGNGLMVQKTATAKSGAAEYKVITDANGYFELDIPETGVYSVSASKDGYLPYSCNVTVDNSVEVRIIFSTPADAASTILQKYKQLAGFSVGYGAGIDHYAGLKFEADELIDYAGYLISTVSFMIDNGGNGTVDKVGVQVYFDDALQCDCECTTPVFNTMCTVDISSYGLKIPSDKSVTFVYYVINPSYRWPYVFADEDKPTEGGNLISNIDDLDWYPCEYGNLVISASIINNSEVIDLAGINYIPHKQSYSAGETFELSLAESSVNPPSSVSWTVNGEPATGSVTLETGVYVVKAFVTYESGRQEIIETKLDVK